MLQVILRCSSLKGERDYLNLALSQNLNSLKLLNGIENLNTSHQNFKIKKFESRSYV